VGSTQGNAASVADIINFEMTDGCWDSQMCQMCQRKECCRRAGAMKQNGTEIEWEWKHEDFLVDATDNWSHA